MATTLSSGIPTGRSVEPAGPSDSLLERAARRGFCLVNYVTESGQEVWEWRRGDEPRPQFVTERVAHRWMSEWLERATEGEDLRSIHVPKHH